MSSREFVSPKKVSDLLIEKVYQVECADHGVIDQCPTYKDAVAARRRHWTNRHDPEGEVMDE